ncbi:MAG: DUF1566 domain-containing protein [Verrucomicrobia bacterium]|nr:DUF1566 domain-containing protein [Verrucomicrobiota bacterium]MCH8511825.1 DUF1566 domain-containing protein [Kiritimatiellia bacterium]
MKTQPIRIESFPLPFMAMLMAICMAFISGCGNGESTGSESRAPGDADAQHNIQVFANTKNPTWTSIEGSLWIMRTQEDPSPNKTGLVWTNEGDPSLDNHIGHYSGETSSLETLIEDLVPGETYRIAAYAEFDFGTVHGNVETFTMPEGPAIGVGEAHQDGIIVYFFQEDDPGYVEGEVHGILAAPMDAGESQWGGRCGRVDDLSPDLGTGKENTRKILAFHEALDNYTENPQQCHEENDGSIAAKLAAEFQHGEHRDWYLPSERELNLLYRNLHAQGIGDFAPTRYWTSSEVPAGLPRSDIIATNIDFSDGQGWTTGKEETMRVRPIRNF